MMSTEQEGNQEVRVQSEGELVALLGLELDKDLSWRGHKIYGKDDVFLSFTASKHQDERETSIAIGFGVDGKIHFFDMTTDKYLREKVKELGLSINVNHRFNNNELKERGFEDLLPLIRNQFDERHVYHEWLKRMEKGRQVQDREKKENPS